MYKTTKERLYMKKRLLLVFFVTFGSLPVFSKTKLISNPQIKLVLSPSNRTAHIQNLADNVESPKSRGAAHRLNVEKTKKDFHAKESFYKQSKNH